MRAFVAIDARNGMVWATGSDRLTTWESALNLIDWAWELQGGVEVAMEHIELELITSEE